MPFSNSIPLDLGGVVEAYPKSPRLFGKGIETHRYDHYIQELNKFHG